MAKLKLDIAGKNAAGVIQYAQNIHTALTGNAYVTTPAPSLASMLTAITAADTANDAYEAEKDTLVAKKAARDAAVLALANILRAEAVTVTTACGGDLAKLSTTGFEIASAPTPQGVPPQVLDLRVKASDDEGHLDASWQKATGANRYEVEASIDPPTSSSWVLKSSSKKTKVSVNTFTSGQRIWLRVRGVGAAGEGSWSDPAVKTVP